MKKRHDISQTVAVTTLGCKVNQCESAAMQTSFLDRGFTLQDFNSRADIYVINTCAVTSKAAAQSRQLIRKALRANPRARVVVTGCYAQIAAESIREMGAETITIVGNAHKHRIFEAAVGDGTGFSEEGLYSGIAWENKMRLLPVKRFSDRTRAFLKIQDGCNNFCSYCIVPHARGRSRSLKPELVLQQARSYAAAGHSEIVLTGIHLGHYGLDLDPSVSLLDLLHELTNDLPTIRFRLSSMEPTEISREFLESMAAVDNLMPHLHIPLQSGSDAILKKMNRRYTPEQFTETIHLCRETVPSAAIGADVLTGFPGESENDFQLTYELVAQLPITYLHVFPYSRRPGTPAAKMAHQVPARVKDERVALLRKLGHKKKTAFYSSRIGTVHPVLVETQKLAGGLVKGLTDNYIPVHFKASPETVGQVMPVKLYKLQDNFVCGNRV